MRELYTSKVFSKPPCLIANIKLKKICKVRGTMNRPPCKGSNRPLAWGTVYCACNCTNFSNFIFAIKQGGLEKTLEVCNSFLAQLA